MYKNMYFFQIFQTQTSITSFAMIIFPQWYSTISVAPSWDKNFDRPEHYF